jgi:hypothetical protein
MVNEIFGHAGTVHTLARSRRSTPTKSPPPTGPDERTHLAIPDAAERVSLVLRLSLLVLVSMLVIATTQIVETGQTGPLIWVCLLAVAALPAWTPPRHPVLVPLGRLAEVAITAIGASTLATLHGGSAASALLPYLTVPIILPALEGRLRESLTLLGVAAALVAAAGLYDGKITDAT